MIIFYFLSAISIWLGVLSLKSGIRFARFLRSEDNRLSGPYEPFLSVIAPCRGTDTGFAENVIALLQQDYADYEVLFVTGDRNDECAIQLERLIEESPQNVGVSLLFAGEAIDSGQKVHNLRFATDFVNSRSEVLVFVDSDARSDPGWLSSLVAPLADETIGATTGYRWFIPVEGGFASHLRSVWNASITSALGENSSTNFCWGGSTAIRRSRFEKLGIRDHWHGTISDDFIITRVLQRHSLPIRFVPDCLLPSFEDCSISELLTFSNRQLQITRVYAPHLWKPLFIGSVIFVLTFFGGIAVTAMMLIYGRRPFITASILAAIFAMGAIKSSLRFFAVDRLMAKRRHKLRGFVQHLLFWPIASVLQLVNCIVAAFSRRVTWRGITYELKTPNETVIIARS